MRTFSFLVAVAALAGVSALLIPLSHRRAPMDSATRPPYQGHKAAFTTVVPPVEPAAEAPALALSDERVVTTADGWQITGEAQPTPEEARQAALSLAQATLLRHLRSREPELQWEPTREFIERRLLKSPPRIVDAADRYRAVVTLRLTPESVSEIHRQKREFQAQGRMLWLGKLLAAFVGLLGAVAGYFRLEDLTKGYYTSWLRLGAGGLAGAALALLLA